MKTAKKVFKTTRNPESVNWDEKVVSVLNSNTKIEKTPAGVAAINSGVSFAPAKRSGFNVCESASAACIAACVLWFAGRTMTAVVRQAAYARTMLWRFSPAVFYARLSAELAKQQKTADDIGARSFCRLNAASDVRHSDCVFLEFPRTTFYDYTKVIPRMLDYLAGKLPPNYHLAYSVSEHTAFADVKRILESGGNVVVVVDSYYWGPTKRYGLLPATVQFWDALGPNAIGFPQSITVETVDGDIQDIRIPEFDGRGRAILLRLKSQSNHVKTAARKSGFARPFSDGNYENSQRFTPPALRGHAVWVLK